MLKVKDFVFALLTLICVSPVVGEERTIYPEAKVWPFIEGFKWGFSVDEFWAACNKKGFTKVIEDSRYPTSLARGLVFGQSGSIKPYFHMNQVTTESALDAVVLTFVLGEDDSKKLIDDLLKIHTERYGKPILTRDSNTLSGPKASYYRWGAPGTPEHWCLELGFGSDAKYNTETKRFTLTGRKFVTVAYKSEKNITLRLEHEKKVKEAETKAKEQEKDF